MIGDAYFQLRAQLGTALFAVQSLASELHAAADRMAALQELGQSLRQPFVFLVLGEPRSGTGVLLDALFGRELWTAELPSSRERVSVWKYADAARDSTSDDTVAEHWRPATFLRDFTVVVSAALHPVVAERFLPEADFVFLVFDAANPWAATGWEIVKRLEGAALERTVFVLQHADGSATAGKDATLAQLEKTVGERAGTGRPIFAVSSQQALEAKLAGRDPAGTGFDALEAFIDAQLAAREPRRTALRELSRGIMEILDELRARVSQVASVVEQDDARRQGLTNLLADRKEQSLRQIGGFLWALAQTHEAAQRRGEELLAAQLTAPAMLRLIANRAFWQSDLREEVEQRLEEAVERHIESSLEALDVDFRSVWQQFHEALERGFPSGARVAAAVPNFDEARAGLAREIAATALEEAAPDRLEDQLGRRFAILARWLRALVALAMGAVLWAGFATISKTAHAELAAVVAASAALLAVALGVLGRRRIVREFRRRMDDKRETLINGIEDHLRPAVNRFYKELEGAFAPLRSFGSGQRKLYASVLDRIAQIEATCRRCDAALGEPTFRS